MGGLFSSARAGDAGFFRARAAGSLWCRVGSSIFERQLIYGPGGAAGRRVSIRGWKCLPLCCACVSEQGHEKTYSYAGAVDHRGSMVDGLSAEAAARALPVVLLGLLLIASAWWDSAFDLRYWAPLTILSLCLVFAQLLTGSLAIPRRGPLAIATAAIWCFAAYVLLTAAWSDSPESAWAEGARSAFYAAIWTLAIGAGAARAWRVRLGGALTVGIVGVAVVTLIGIAVDGTGFFLAGRLDSPIGYRNATAALFAFAVWPLIGYAARWGNAVAARAVCAASSVLLLGLAFLTQSRGVLIGLALGGVVTLSIGPDRVRRAWVAVGAVALVAVFASHLLAPYDAFTKGVLEVRDSDINTAVYALAGATGLAFLVGMLLFVLDNGLRSADRFRGLAVVGLAVLAAVVAIAGLAKIGNPVSYVDTKVTEFKEIEPASTGGSTRLGSVGGQRSDLWRVALDQFAAHPLAGAGAGSYQFAYYRDRHTDRNLSDTHSLPLRLLADTGLIGAGLFAAWLIAIGVAIARRARDVGRSERVWIAGLAAAGTTVLAQCLSDWLWLLPGLMGLSFLALGLAAGGEEDESGPPEPRGRATRLVAAAGLGAAIVSVVFLFLGNLFVRDARVDAYRSPQSELSAARTAAWFDPVALAPLYLQASALESEGRRGEAKTALEDALDLEPENFVTLGLLGDFEVRGGNLDAVHGFYDRALALNPLDSGLRKLSEDTE